jgi:hypothetical protein
MLMECNANVCQRTIKITDTKSKCAGSNNNNQHSVRLLGTRFEERNCISEPGPQGHFNKKTCTDYIVTIPTYIKQNL